MAALENKKKRKISSNWHLKASLPMERNLMGSQHGLRAVGSRAGAALTESFQWEKISKIVQSNLGGWSTSSFGGTGLSEASRENPGAPPWEPGAVAPEQQHREPRPTLGPLNCSLRELWVQSTRNRQCLLLISHIISIAQWNFRVCLSLLWQRPCLGSFIPQQKEITLKSSLVAWRELTLEMKHLFMQHWSYTAHKMLLAGSD